MSSAPSLDVSRLKSVVQVRPTASKIRANFDTSPYVEAKARILNEYLRSLGVSRIVTGWERDVSSMARLAILLSAADLRDNCLERVDVVASSDTLPVLSVKPLASAVPDEIEVSPGHGTVKLVCSTIGKARIDSEHHAIFEQAMAKAIYDIAIEAFEEGGAIVCGVTRFCDDGLVDLATNNTLYLHDLELLSDLRYSEIVELANAVQEEGLRINEALEVPVSVPAVSINSLHQEYEECTRRLRKAHHGPLTRLEPRCHLPVYAKDVLGRHSVQQRLKMPSDETLHSFNAVKGTSLPKPMPLLDAINDYFTSTVRILDGSAGVQHLADILTNSEVDEMMECLQSCSWRESDINGQPVEHASMGAGSLRTSIFDEGFAESLWQRLQPQLPLVETFHDSHALTDTDGTSVWTPVGISPLLRFMKYDPTKGLVPHYDSTFVASGDIRTLYTVVIYLRSNESGGTRFYTDVQRVEPYAARTFGDQKQCREQVIEEFLPVAGHGIMFPHRLLHDSAPLVNGTKVILRTDVLFHRCHASVWNRTQGLGLQSKLQSITDPYYAAASERYGADELIEGGYLGVQHAEPLDSNWLSTPISKVAAGLSSEKDSENDNENDPVVLFSTGCYNPIHPGHLSILDAAKMALEEKNVPVVGGYIVPAHQSYVDEKAATGAGQHASLSAMERLSSCAAAVASESSVSSWLEIDPFEVLYGLRDVDFTAIQQRLEQYLRDHLDDRIRLVYVFGGDRASFARAYWKQGRTVCVKRPGYNDVFAKYQRELCGKDAGDCEDLGSRMDRVIWIDQPKISVDTCSSSIRRHTPPRESMAVETNAPLPKFKLRLESETYRDFAAELGELFLKSLPPCKLEICTVTSQKKVLEEEVAKLRQQYGSCLETVSLDAFIPGEHNLAISRLYQLSQLCPSQNPALIGRPGCVSIDEQLARIPSGSEAPPYAVFDDDIATGGTMRRAVELVEADGLRKVVARFSLTSEHPRPLDIADTRDFSVGAANGGLAVSLPSGVHARAPYLLPYVSPAARASVRPAEMVIFSAEVWALNARWYEQSGVRVGDVDPSVGALLDYVGFSKACKMEDVCRWHCKRLKASVGVDADMCHGSSCQKSASCTMTSTAW